MTHHYAYIEATSAQFSKALGLSGDVGSLIGGHGDKLYQYHARWNGANIPAGKAGLVYLLSYLTPYCHQVRRTPKGFVEPWKWVVEQCTQPGRIKNALDSLPKKVWRKEIDDNEFHVTIDGTIRFKALREFIEIKKRKYVPGQTPEYTRGDWCLNKIAYDQNGSVWEQMVDKDQYSNDLIERIQSGKYD